MSCASFCFGMRNCLDCWNSQTWLERGTCSCIGTKEVFLSRHGRARVKRKIKFRVSTGAVKVFTMPILFRVHDNCPCCRVLSVPDYFVWESLGKIHVEHFSPYYVKFSFLGVYWISRLAHFCVGWKVNLWYHHVATVTVCLWCEWPLVAHSPTSLTIRKIIPHQPKLTLYPLVN